MSQVEVQQYLNSISLKIKKLKQRTDRLEKDNAELRETVFKHLATIKQLNDSLKFSENKDSLQGVSTNSKLDNKKIVTTLDSYIKLIDQTIANVKAQ